MANLKLQQKKSFSENNLRRFANILIGLTAGQESLASQCLTDYIDDGSRVYQRGNITIYNGYIWEAKTVAQGTFDESKWTKIGTDEFTELDLDTIKSYLNLSQDELDNLQNLIDDAQITLTKTHSSSKIYMDIQQCLEDGKTFTLKEISKLSGASYKVVTSTSEMTSESIIYLLPNATNYDMYIVETDGTATKIGDTNINLDNYFTKTEIEADFLKKTDADSKYATITTVTTLDTHINDTDIHITADERTKWNNTADKVDGAELVKKADIKTTTLDENATDDEIYSGKAIYDAIQNNVVGKETILYDTPITGTGTYTLTDDVNNYDFIIINYSHYTGNTRQSVTMSKNDISKCIDTDHRFGCVDGHGTEVSITTGHFNNNKLIIDYYDRQSINSITGYKFGEVTVANTITNPAPAASYSTDEQLTGGTWIDGKPIYRKTVFINLAPANGSGQCDVSSLNVDTFIRAYGTGNHNTETGLNVNIPYSDGGYSCSMSMNKDEKKFYVSSKGAPTYNMYITIEFTKTTD